MKRSLFISSIFLTVFSVFCGIFSAQNVFAIEDAYASANDFYFSNATFDYYLEKTETGSKMHVKETLVAEFPDTNQNHGITRSIPFVNQDGKNLVANSKSDLNFTVTRNGKKESVAKTETENNMHTFYIGDKDVYVHGTQEYVLEYDFTNVVTEFIDTNTMTWAGENATFQELYWDANGTGWSQKFEKLTANLHLPSDAAENVLKNETSCYVGKYGASGASSSSRCYISNSGDTITFTTYNLAARENLTFVVDFKPGTFIVPLPQKSNLLIIVTAGFAAITILIFVLALLRYFKVISEKYRYKKSLFVAPQYAPPKGLTVADAKYLFIGHSKSSFVATLIELAVEHKISIIKTDKKTLLGKAIWKIKIEKLGEITSAERDILEILHGGSSVHDGDEFEVKKHSATVHLQSLSRDYETSSMDRLRKLGYFHPESEKKYGFSIIYVLLVIFVLFFYFIFGVIFCAEYGELMNGGISLFFIALGCILISVLILEGITERANKIKSHTKEGIAASNELSGLKMYIKMAEKDRLKFLQSVKGADTSAKGIVKLYEKLLPYAIIFGQEESWMEELNRYYEENPSIEHGWYSGSDYLSIAMFHSMMSTTSSTISSSTSYSSSSSSSSSGGGGGGFSGGGGGGGGGGGW